MATWHIGPNGFTRFRYQSTAPTSVMLAVHWFRGVGLVVHRSVEGKTVRYRILFRSAARRILQIRMHLQERLVPVNRRIKQWRKKLRKIR
jgi:hypothetical protein